MSKLLKLAARYFSIVDPKVEPDDLIGLSPARPMPARQDEPESSAIPPFSFLLFRAFSCFSWPLAGLLVALATTASAQTQDAPVGVAVKVWAQGTAASTPSSLSVSGTFLPLTPDGTPETTPSAANPATTASWGGQMLTFITGSAGYVRIVPDHAYTLFVNAPNIHDGALNIVAPPGYRVLMDHMYRSRETFDTTLTAVFELQPLGARHPGLAGLASGLSVADIDWSLSLGNLRNGASAGVLALSDTGMRADWAPIFSPVSLSYETPSDEIWVYRVAGAIRQIRANQVVVDVVTLNSTSYEIRCYHPSQERDGQVSNSDQMTFVGQPYVTYRIEQGATATTLQITREVRNVVDPLATNLSIARAEVTSIARTGAWPNYQWTRSDWTVVGQSPLSETIVQSSGTSSSRTESIFTRTPGATSAVRNASRTYAVPLTSGVSVVGEVLNSETVGTSTGLSASFDYYTDPTKFGSLGYVKSATLPGGKWVAFDYYDSDIASGFRGGQVKHSYKPYLNAPAVVTLNLSSGGEVTSYGYTNDIFGVPSRPSSVETTIGGTVSRILTSYNDNYATVNGYAVTEATRDDNGISGQLITVTRSYRDDISDGFVRSQTYSVTAPDGVKQSFAYQRGSWDGTTFTPGSGIGLGGNATRVSVILGTTNSSAGSNYTTVDTCQIDPLYLVDGKSTKDVTIRDSRALVVRTESYGWKSNAWVLLSYTNYTYDFGGRLIQRVASNGATYTAAYDGGLKTSDTDEAGVTTTYTYDASDRTVVTTRLGVGSISTVATRATYDAAGQVTRTDVGWGQSEMITSQVQYDDAGRVTVETPPGNYGIVSHIYDATNRTHTVTNAEGGTVITTANLDGSLASTTGTATVPAYHTYGVGWVTGISRLCQYHQVNTGTPNSPRWQKTWTDFLGRVVETDAPGFTGQPNIVAMSVYDVSTSHLLRTTKTGMAPTLYQYNALGQVSRSGLDYNNNGVLDLYYSDRISETDSYFENYNSAWWLRTDTKTYPPNNVPVVTSSRKRLTGFPANRISETQTIDAEGNVTSQVVDVDRANATSRATTTQSGIVGAMVENSVDGYSVSVTGYDGLTTSTTRDALLRTSSVTVSRGNTATTTYAPGTNLMQTVTDASGAIATTAYDTLGRVSWQRDSRNYYARSGYNLRGQLVHQWGDGTLPVEYGYDATYGDRITQSTFRGGTGWDSATWPTTPGTADTTTWTYDAPSGLLITKKDAPTPEHPNGCSVTQTYNAAGKTATRTLARGVTTTYGYDASTGELLSQTYSDSTPSVTYTYDRLGQVASVADYTGTRTLAYNTTKPWRLTAETEDVFYGARVVTRMYDENGVIGRVHGFQVGAAAGNNADLEQTFGFTTVGRFASISTNRLGNGAATHTFRYGYLSNAALLQSVALDNSPFTITRSYEDHRDFVTSINAQWSTASRARFDYTYDERGQRHSAVQSGDVFADYGDSTLHLYDYDGRGEVVADFGYLGSNPADQSKPLPGRHYEYTYDNAGNRQTANRTGVAGLADHYTTNALNQYVSRENNTLPVSGTAAPDTGGAGGTAVAVQGRTVPAGRQGRYWDDEITVANTLHPWRGPVTIFTAKRGTGGSPDLYRMDARMAEIASILQTFTYDADGNLTSDGLADYQWDAENRLVRIETSAMAQTWGFPHHALQFRYDYMGRRVLKQVLSWDSSQGAWNLDSERRYLYDGWNLVAEYTYTSTSTLNLVRSYTWGLDIVTSQTKAGGVGALLQIADHASGKTYLPTYDGNGNVVALLNADTGTLAAAYEYSPYGEPLRSQTFDPTIADQPFRFSTKFTDLETGLVYYGHRYYSPSLGRFINRDPIEESGGLNLYGFCGNNGVNRWDYLGNWAGDIPSGAPQWVKNIIIETLLSWAGRSGCNRNSVNPWYNNWLPQSGYYDNGVVVAGTSLNLLPQSQSSGSSTSNTQSSSNNGGEDGTTTCTGTCGEWGYGQYGWGFYAPGEFTWDPTAVNPDLGLTLGSVSPGVGTNTGGSPVSVGSSNYGNATGGSNRYPFRQLQPSSCAVAAVRNVIYQLTGSAPSEESLAEIMAKAAGIPLSNFTTAGKDMGLPTSGDDSNPMLAALSAALRPYNQTVTNPNRLTFEAFQQALQSGNQMIVAGNWLQINITDGTYSNNGHAYVLNYNQQTQMVSVINPGLPTQSGFLGWSTTATVTSPMTLTEAFKTWTNSAGTPPMSSSVYIIAPTSPTGGG